jgi:2-oxoglutarate/2-oxoacid ferredoxin oxidoreductase subunit alpha
MSSRINDFAIKLANVNGSGSASANSLIMQAIFRMGVPVSGKNLFPSNIQGLPTWYEIRVNKDGYTARALDYDLMIAMNAQTYDRDVQEVRSGGYVLYDSSWPLDASLIREDVTYIGVPFAEMCNANFRESRERVLMKNIATAGALIELLNIDREIIAKLIEEKYGRKKGLRESNQKALSLGADYVRENHPCPLPFHLQTMDGNAGKILVDGNTAAALGCVYAGATVAAWYPITPSTSTMDAFKAFCERFRVVKDKDGKTTEQNYLILQAEDELAAVGMVLGASWSGARAFTSTAGPGISLMNELLGYAYFAEIPVVVIDVQRVGPSTGMPTRTQQGDIMECAYASHGDTKHILLFPANPAECFDLAVKSFDLAEQFQTPVFLLTDLDIGMNDWVTPKLSWDDSYRPNRGKVLNAEELKSIEHFQRYMPVNGSAIAPRTIPGVSPKGAYFTRGSGHNKFGAYTEIPDEYQEVMDRLLRKHKEAAGFVPAPIIEKRKGASVGVITVGGCDSAVREALDILAAQGTPMDYMRIRAFPFDEPVDAFITEHDFCYVVEQNRDAQLRSLLILETTAQKEKLKSILVYGGFPLSASHVVSAVTADANTPEAEELDALYR